MSAERGGNTSGIFKALARQRSACGGREFILMKYSETDLASQRRSEPCPARAQVPELADGGEREAPGARNMLTTRLPGGGVEFSERPLGKRSIKNTSDTSIFHLCACMVNLRYRPCHVCLRVAWQGRQYIWVTRL